MSTPPSTIADVAKKAGVSTATVSRMINGIGPVGEATQKRVRDAISDLNYSPRRKRRNRNKAAVRDGAAHHPIAFLRIGPFMKNEHHLVTESLTEALYVSAQASGRTLSVIQVPELQTRSVREVIGDAEGVVIRTSNEKEMFPEVLEWLNGIPAVQVLGMNRLDRLWLDHVSPDNVQAGILAANYLIEKGCSQLVFAARSLNGGISMDRCIAFVKAALMAGKEVKVIAQFVNGDTNLLEQEIKALGVDCVFTDTQVELIRNIASVGKDGMGLFVPTDFELAMLIPQLQLMGVEFGGKSIAIGCDHESRCMAGLDPVPATLELHHDNLAARAIRRIIQRIKYPNEPLVRISVAPELVTPGQVMRDLTALKTTEVSGWETFESTETT